MNKKMREIKAQIEMLNDKATKLFEAKDLEGAENTINEIENLEREYKVAEKLFKGGKDEVTDDVVATAKKVNKVTDFANGIRKIRNSMNETTGTDGGYTVPEDVQNDIDHLREAKKSLENLVTVEKVNSMSGKRTYKKRSSLTGFNKVGEGSKIGINSTPKYDVISYNIQKYAGILPVTNELFEDSDANIYNELINWIADESRVTRNNLILEVINKKPEVDLEDLDGIKKTLNVTLGQAFKETSKIVTNDDGLQYLDTLKDKDGNYVLTTSPSDPMKLVLAAGTTKVPVEVYPNGDIKSKNIYTKSTDTSVDAEKIYYTLTENNYVAVASPTGNPSTSNYYEVTNVKYPFIIGDLKEGIKLFDRNKTNIMTSNTAAAGELNAFEEDLTLFRAIEREDTQIRDEDAFINGYITPKASI